MILGRFNIQVVLIEDFKRLLFGIEFVRTEDFHYVLFSIGAGGIIIGLRAQQSSESTTGEKE